MNESAEDENAETPATPIKRVLGTINHREFSEKGFENFNEQVAGYIKDLLDESARVARRYRADLISAVHIEKAAEHLASGSASRNYRYVGTIGGIVLGGGLSEVLSMVSTDTVTIIGLVTSCACFAIGAVLVTLHAAKD